MKKTQYQKTDKDFVEDLIAEVKDDFLNRREERRGFESQWQLNANFLLGNQYTAITPGGEIADSVRDYYWQEREIYNHIAPIVETRLAKLTKSRPKMIVRPASNDEADITTAAVATKILNSAYHGLNVEGALAKGTQWSEVTGSVFYKLSWDSQAGRLVGYRGGEPVYEGEVRIDVCPPYEIFPSSVTAETVEECESIIHAKAMHIDDIQRIWGQPVKSEDIDTLSLDNISVIGGLGLSSAIPKLNRSRKKDHAIVIERYSKPTREYPEGRLVIVAGNTLLYYGPLPFKCGENNTYALPFIKQDAQIHPGCFYGISMIERAIPVQRAYNAVKNRKHEFMNRIAMGVLAVEDGSVDLDNLESEGLSPGKILVYRQGSPLPVLLNPGTIPPDFSYEEDRLLNEFIMVSGVSEVMSSSNVPSSVTSGTALKLLLEQDDTRLATTADRICRAAKQMAKMILRLYKQFASSPRLSRCVGEKGGVELIRWKATSLTSDDIIFDTENEAIDSYAARKEMVFDLLKSGLLNDENGKLSDATRHKVLSLLGFSEYAPVKEETDGRAE